MNAEERLELLNAYADGELDEEQRKVVEQLLRDDPDAAYESTQIVNLKDLLGRWQGVPTRGSLKDRLMNEVARERPADPETTEAPAPHKSGRGGTWGMVGLAVVLFLVGAFFLIQYLTAEDEGPDIPPPPPPVVNANILVELVEGAAQVAGGGATVDSPLRQGMTLRPGQQLTTTDAARVELRVGSARVVVLGNSVLQVVDHDHVAFMKGRVLVGAPADAGAVAVDFAGNTLRTTGCREAAVEIARPSERNYVVSVAQGSGTIAAAGDVSIAAGVQYQFNADGELINQSNLEASPELRALNE